LAESGKDFPEDSKGGGDGAESVIKQVKECDLKVGFKDWGQGLDARCSKLQMGEIGVDKHEQA
jgi:hypothetical protein